MSSEFEREQQLRRLLAEAVEPVEPSPGAQTRLLARARAQQRRRSRPLMARLGVPAAVVSFIAVVVLAVLFVGHANRGSSGSSASTEAGGTIPSRAPESSSAAATSGNAAAASPQAQVPTTKDLSNSKGASTTYSGNGTSASKPQADALRPAGLDGDGRPDTFTLSAGTLTAKLSSDGTQSVDLPEFGPGGKVLGVSALTNQNGAMVAVVFVRLRQVGSSSTDTIVSLVQGRLTVLQLGSGPVLLTIDASHGYGCSQGTLAVSGNATPFAVDGSSLVRSAVVRAAAATPVAKSDGCGF